VSMHFAHVIQSRKVRACAILAALSILVIWIAAVLLRSRRAPKPFEMDDLMACWIKWLPEVGTDHAL
jgi:hypothetical protein